MRKKGDGEFGGDQFWGCQYSGISPLGSIISSRLTNPVFSHLKPLTLLLNSANPYAEFLVIRYRGVLQFSNKFVSEGTDEDQKILIYSGFCSDLFDGFCLLHHGFHFH